MKKCPKCGKEYAEDITLCPVDGVALETTGDTLIGQTLANKYRIDERISEGGMGKVYRGTHVLMDKTVAVKVLRPSFAADEKIVARFSREARAASRISHPHALSVTDFGEDEEGRVFLVMEYLQGRTLKEIVRAEGSLNLERIVEIVRQVGGALQAAHDEGVIHRDLKCENIMLINTGGADYAKVLDFGIAKIMEPEGGHDAELTAPNLVIGTPQYMSPEQCSQSAEIDSRSDLYSLGIIIYEMLSGRVPFSGESPTAIMLKQMQEPVPSILDLRKDLPASIAQVVNRALAKEPNQRYQRVEELVEDLTIAASLGTSEQTAQRQMASELEEKERPYDDDEETVVRPRVEPAVPRAPITVRTPLPPPVRSSFNPWKILIPSAAGLLVIFAVIYAFTRNSEPVAAPQQGSSLVADPNSQPVVPVPPPTGKGEMGIPVGGSISSQPANVNAEASPSPSFEPSPAASVGVGGTGNTNESANANTNRSASPQPSASRPVNVSEPPPPPPTPAATPPRDNGPRVTPQNPDPNDTPR